MAIKILNEISPDETIKEKRLNGVRSFMYKIYNELNNEFDRIEKSEINSYVPTSDEAYFYDNFYYIKKIFGEIFTGFDKQIYMPCIKRGHYQIPVSFIDAYCSVSSKNISGNDFRTLADKRKYTSMESERFTDFLKCAAIIHICENVSVGKSSIEWFEMLRRITDLRSEYISESLSYAHRFLKNKKTYINSDRSTRLQYRIMLEREAKDKSVDIELLYKNEKKLFETITSKLNRKAKYDIRCSVYFILLYLLTVLPVISFCFILKNIFPVILLLPMYYFAKEALNAIFLRLIKPNYMPRYKSEYAQNIPVCLIIPVLLKENTHSDIYKKLEKAYLRNRSGKIFFGVLCDYNENANRSAEKDEKLSQDVCNTINKLNIKYGNIFFGFVRYRSFSDTQKKYIGRERKRGAITDIFRYISSGENVFYKSFGCTDDLKKCRYASIIDFDTEISINSVSQLLSVITHPANKSYGIIAPRLSNITDKSKSTLYNEIISEYHGIDGYSRPISNLANELTGHGIFAGKGIINIESYLNKALDLPHERILSHDFIEGAVLNTGIASDIVFYEEEPMSFSAYKKRAHRWVRGDWQSTLLLFSDKLSAFDKYILLDNLSESLSGSVYIFALILSAFVSPSLLAVLLLVMIMRIDFPLRTELYSRIITGINSITSVKFCSGVYAPLKLKIYNVLLHLIEVPYTAINNLDAVCRALFRQYVSKRNLLQWTTSSDSSGAASNIKEYILPEIVSFIFFFVLLYCGIFYNNYLYILPAIICVVWIMAPVILEDISKRGYTRSRTMTNGDIKRLYSYANDMWEYYNDNLTDEYNWLIPDNVQEDPPIGAALRTSPTNIGFSVLAAADAYVLGMCTKQDAVKAITNILNTVESLPKYHGHLFNWYDIKNKKPLNPDYISFVDSGNFSVCLLTASEIIDDKSLKVRLQNAARLADFSFLFNKTKMLFHIGFNVTDGKLSKNFYDILASESRLSVFWLISEDIVPFDAWQAMARITVKNKHRYGLSSWSGTVFEFFMPEIFLKTAKGSMLNEALYFAVFAQKDRCGDKPFGISESCYYSFSKDFAYKYKAMGVQAVGLRTKLNKDFTVSPYSTFLMMDTSYNDALNNLSLLEKENMVGKYGFYEAIDYKSNSKPMKCYMAHHIGMSFTMLANVLADDINRKSFETIPSVNAYKYLLDEQIKPYAVTGHKTLSFNMPKQKSADIFYNPNAASPKGMVYTNGKYTMLTLDNGIGFSTFCNFSLTKYRKNTEDFPCGIFLLAKIKDKTIPLNFSVENNLSVSIKNDRIVYRLTHDDFEIETIAAVSNDYCSEIRKITIKNSSKTSATIELYVYLEPVLSLNNAESRHPAYNSLMIEAKKSDTESAVLFRKRDEINSVSICCGFVDCKSEYETVKDRLLPYGNIITDTKTSQFSFNGVNEACINPVFCQKTTVKINRNAKKEIKFILAAGYDYNKAELEYKLSRNSHQKYAGSHDNEIARNLLPKLFYNTNPKHCDAFTDKNRKILWNYGISGDRSILLIHCNGTIDISPYMEMYSYYIFAGLQIDIVFIADDSDYDKPFSNSLNIALAEYGLNDYMNNGIFIVSPKDRNACDFLEIIAEAVLFNGKDENHAVMHAKKISHLNKSETPSHFTPQGYYVGKDADKAPYCNILTNGTFGTVLSQKSLGFTYAFNSGLYKITRWSNDPASDNRCEMLYLKTCGKYYDIIRESNVNYTENSAEYSANINGISIKVKVYAAQNINAKIIDILTDSSSDAKIIYSIDPLLTENMNDSLSHIQYIKNDAIMYFSNPCDMSYPNACAYLKGNSESNICENNGRIEISENLKQGNTRIQFILGCEKDFESAKTAKKTTLIPCKYFTPCRIFTKEKSFDDFFNTFLYKQIRDSRLNARAAFYQVSGAFGFRDQLQDAICISSVDINYLKNQIIKACAHQFESGDVMHWWHEITSDISSHKGVKTKCSDDMLWLPLAVSEYVKKTGDFHFLSADISYLKAEELSENERDKYIDAIKSDISESIYDHCIKAFKRSFRIGAHGLMLMGTGDWNDGFSNVGANGKGESIWLSMFYCYVSNEFEFILKQMSDTTALKMLHDNREMLIDAVENNGWDGKYYLRGYYDNGTFLGSHHNDECKIDIMPQIFASLAGCFDKYRCKKALESVDKLLVDRKNRIIKLFDIPFRNGNQDPGYIKNYVGGVRENGGQYTHAAAFYAYALFKCNDPDKGFEMLCLLNPNMRDDMETYKNEPYVLSGDIYTSPGFVGRGGWSWYTGSAGWYYRTVIEEMLGVKIIDGNITIHPNLPSSMDGINFKLNINGTNLKVKAKREGKYVMIENDTEIPYIKSDNALHEITVLF